MDPNETVRLLVDALRDGDTSEARERMNDVATWIEGGGFTPTVKLCSRIP